MTDNEINEEEMSALIADAQESEQDIRALHMTDFINKWQQVRLDNIPVQFLNFRLINRFVYDRNPDALGHWDAVKPASPDAIKQILGFELGAAFIDWLTMTRTAYVLQQMSTNMKFNFIEMGMDNEGNVCYSVVESNPKLTDELRSHVERVIAANSRV
ncbi:hypothetical protein FDI69_gp118 [Rhodococcus phage Trina]|uniref:Uncharacterized protein n=1 Tax=Rhodococcus phage Trina TaxID=2027905 RepID=A0A2D1A284_9CAUD|nr:hypothetical protein FDI69_gp118 [Rhodococcus phage Trina]ASZ74932.1 hypothetical protein SEA_TRINA_118 [Rhodococcus phage Trina]